MFVASFCVRAVFKKDSNNFYMSLAQCYVQRGFLPVKSPSVYVL